MNALAVILQVGGTVLAGYCVIAEWASSRNDDPPPTMHERRRKQPRPLNPWAERTLSFDLPNISHTIGDFAALEREFRTAMYRLTDTVLKDRARAEKAWDRQFQVERQLAEADRELLAIHLPTWTRLDGSCVGGWALSSSGFSWSRLARSCPDTALATLSGMYDLLILCPSGGWATNTTGPLSYVTDAELLADQH